MEGEAAPELKPQPQPQPQPEPVPEPEPEPEPELKRAPPRQEEQPVPEEVPPRDGVEGAAVPEPQPELQTVGLGGAPDIGKSVEVPPAPVGFTVPGAEPESQLSQMVAQFQKLQALAPQEREPMLAELPPEVSGAARVAVKLPPEAVDKLATAAATMQNGEPPSPEAIGTAYSLFSQLPPESKAVIISQLPPQVSHAIAAFAYVASLNHMGACLCLQPGALRRHRFRRSSEHH
jgi:hypothetical protein